MKKLFALLLACLMIVGMFAGCNKKDAGDEKGSVYYLNFKPEFNDALTELAKKYQEKTGIEVKIVTAASGDYNNTLTSNISHHFQHRQLRSAG